MSTLTYMDYVTKIHDDFVAGRLQRVVYTEFDPIGTDGFQAVFAERFNCDEGSESLVREALEYLEQMGAIDVQQELVRPATAGSKKQYPAEYRVTVQLR